MPLTPLSEHFTWAEVTRSPTAEARGIDNSLPPGFVDNVRWTAEQMEVTRSLLGGVPITVTSWFRCPALNLAIGGAKSSAHLRGLAVDWRHSRLSLEEAFERVAATRLVLFDQLIIERTRDGARWIHLGFTRSTPRREILRAEGDRLGGPMSYRRVAIG